MPLSPVNFVPKGPVKSADMNQFFNLFTGVMVDQPVTFSNVLNVGGSQGNTTVPLKLYGAPGQTSHLIDLYPDKTSAQPGFGFSALGTFGWGPGGTAPIDTTLSRIATQVGHGADTPGLLVSPQLEVNGNIVPHGSIVWPSGNAAIADGGGGIVNVGINLAVQSALYLGYDHSTWLTELRGGEIMVHNRLSVNGADAEGVALTYGNAMLQTRGADMPDTAGTFSIPFSAHAFAGNWLQFNPKFYKVTAGNAWPGIALLLDYDVDNANAAGGRISLMNGRMGVGSQVVDANGSLLQVFGEIQGAFLTSTGGGQINQNLGVAGSITVGGSVSIAVNQSFGSSGAMLWYDSASTVIQAHASGTRWVNNVNNANLMTLDNIGNLVLNAGDITLNGTRVLHLGGANDCLVSPGENVNRPGAVYLSPHCYVFFDLGVGHIVTCQQVIQTSDPSLKSAMTVMTDTDCMARIRDPNVQVHTYVLNPPTPAPSPPPPQPTPTQTDIGFDATQVYASSPEFAALDANSNPVGVNYANMSAMIWGALRSLDARCVAKGI
jgi:hypothetical protein